MDCRMLFNDTLNSMCRKVSDLEESSDLSDLDVADFKGRSLLHYAARIGNVKLTTLLIKAGIDPNVTDDDLNTPLFEAVHNGHRDVAEDLIEVGADVNWSNYLGQTPLMMAVMYDDLQLIKLLHKQGALLDEVDCTGRSALLIGLEDLRVKSCKYLLGQGCNIDIVDNSGNNALDILENIKGKKNCVIYKKILDAMIKRICSYSVNNSDNTTQVKSYFKLFNRRSCS